MKKVLVIAGPTAAGKSDFAVEMAKQLDGIIISGDSIQVYRGFDIGSGKITKAEIMEKCPDISQVTVQRTLIELQKKGEIIKLGGGRYTAYIWNREID